MQQNKNKKTTTVVKRFFRFLVIGTRFQFSPKPRPSGQRSQRVPTGANGRQWMVGTPRGKPVSDTRFGPRFGPRFTSFDGNAVLLNKQTQNSFFVFLFVVFCRCFCFIFGHLRFWSSNLSFFFDCRLFRATCSNGLKKQKTKN